MYKIILLTIGMTLQSRFYSGISESNAFLLPESMQFEPWGAHCRVLEHIFHRTFCLFLFWVKSSLKDRGRPDPECLLGTMFNQQQSLPHIKFQPQYYVQSGHDPRNSNSSDLDYIILSYIVSSDMKLALLDQTLRSGSLLRAAFLLEVIDLCLSVQVFLCLSKNETMNMDLEYSLW